MKRKIFIILILIFSLGLIYTPIKLVKADSGWDSDYDSGGWDSDWDSGSDWSSGSDWDYDDDYSGGSHYSGSSSSDSSIGVVIAIVIIVVIVIIVINNKNNRNGGRGGNRPSNMTSNNYKDIDVDKITSIDPNIDVSEFKAKAFQIYKDIQTAWMNFDTDTIRKLTTDEIYNMYSSQLDTLKLKKQKNIMKDISLMDIKIIDIKKEDDVISLSVYLKVKCYDYVIKEDTGETVRGRDKDKIIIEYVMSFVKSASNNKNEEKCPNCGAPVDIVSSATCPYCDSVLVKNSSDYVMSKKTTVGQSLDR